MTRPGYFLFEIHFQACFMIDRYSIIVSFLLRLIRPALHYKHNLFNRIYSTNSIKDAMFIM